jgi:hypothetical protein
MHAQLKLDEPWDSQHNLAWSTSVPDVFVCPDDRQFAPGDTSYCVVVGDNFAFHPQTGIDLATITDDVGSTLLIVEVQNSGINWMAPSDITPTELAQGINSGVQGTCGSNHPGGVAIVGTADAHAHVLSDAIGPNDLRAMATIAGGDNKTRPFGQ